MNSVSAQMIEDLVAKALEESNSSCCSACAPSTDGKNGIFEDIDASVEAAFIGQQELMKLTINERGKLIEAIRKISVEHAEELAKMEVTETGFGRYEDKVRKVIFTVEKTPGIEDLQTEAFTGDCGISVVERMPFGVACCITPSTGPATTAIHNAICMIAAGNSVVFSSHPNAINSSIRAVELINEAILSAGGPKNVINLARCSSLDDTNKLIKHPKIRLVVATGGPGVVKTILSCGKKAIGAGPGNPPAVVDETADIPNAARSIVAGNHFENGIQCICEKEIVVVDSVADQLIDELVKAGAYLIRDPETIEKLTKLVTTPEGKPNVKYVGKDPEIILRDIGIEAKDVKSITYEVPKEHITVVEEYLMSLLPIVRVKDIDEAIKLAVQYEGGRRHTAMIHSKNVTNMTRYARAMSCTVLVKNGPSFSGLGNGGEGFTANTVAGPTGEGITSPRTFTRLQRCALIGEFNLRSSTL